MAKNHFTLSSYDPVYVIAPEVKIPEEHIRAQALRWLELQKCKPGEKARLTDKFVETHCQVEEFKTVDDLMIFIRYNMYRDNRENQELADQAVVCAELATRLVEDLPEELVEDSVYAANWRLEDMLSRMGQTAESFAQQRGITVEQMYEDVKKSTIQSLREDSALAAYAEHEGLTLEADDFYACIPGENLQDKAYKRRQIELEGRLPEMEQYALKTKALKLIMEDAMIKRSKYDQEWLRYGDTSADVLNANKQFPDSFVL